MTRINLIRPQELHQKHLIAEYRELPRVFSLIRADDIRRAAGKKVEEPAPRYTMGTGHVRFFYNKAIWLLDRQRSLVEEMRARGFKPTFEPDLNMLNGIDMRRQLTEWSPTEAEITINRERIELRLSEMRAK